MNVVLHGAPGSEGKDIWYETGKDYFENTIIVRFAELTIPRVTPYTGKEVCLENIKYLDKDIRFKFTHDVNRIAHYSIIVE